MKAICVGMGNRGKLWYHWAQEAGLKVLGVVDRNPETLKQSCDEEQIPESMRFTSTAEAARATGAVMATICTDNPSHAQCLQDGLDAGLHAFIEKPMVQTPEQARAVIAKATQTGLRVGVGQNYRYMTGPLTLADAVRRGLIGEVLKIHVDFYRWRPTRGLLLPLMLNQAIHHFDAVRFILGADPARCYAKSWNPQWNDCDGPTVLEALWEFDSDAVFSYSGSYVTGGAQTPYSGIWRIEGSTGNLHFTGDYPEAPVILRRREPEHEETLPAISCGMNESAKVCLEFVEAIRAGKTPPTDASDNVKSLGMCWSAELSSRKGGPVTAAEAIEETDEL